MADSGPDPTRIYQPLGGRWPRTMSCHRRERCPERGHWRRGWDLNPGKACTFNSFQVRMPSGYDRPITCTPDQNGGRRAVCYPRTSTIVRRHCCQIAVKHADGARLSMSRDHSTQS